MEGENSINQERERLAEMVKAEMNTRADHAQIMSRI
jgi:hypothetical protein